MGVLKSPLVIKPNVCTSLDKTGFATTDVEVVKALIDLISKEDRSLSIKIVESDSESRFAGEAFEKFGYRNLATRCREHGLDVCLVNLSEQPTVSTRLDGLFQEP